MHSNKDLLGGAAGGGLDPSALTGAKHRKIPKDLARCSPRFRAGLSTIPTDLRAKLDGSLHRRMTDARSACPPGASLPDGAYPALTEALSVSSDLSSMARFVALDEQARPSFEPSAAMNLTGAHDIRRADATVPVVYYVFDLLSATVRLRGVVLEERKRG